MWMVERPVPVDLDWAVAHAGHRCMCLQGAKAVPWCPFRTVQGWCVAAKAQATATRCATFLRFLPKRKPAAFSINRVMI